MKWVNIFLLICALSTVVLMTYMSTLYDESRATQIVAPTLGAPLRKVWPPAAWWRSTAGQTVPKTKAGSVQRNLESGNVSITSVTPTTLPENSTADVIPPIIFDDNSTNTTMPRPEKDKDALPAGDPTACTRQDNVVFIKTHKTGSTSLSHVVNRYGFVHNLSFVFNKLSPANGHLVYLPLNADSPRTHFLPPIGVRPGDFSKYKYNMLAVHVRYNRRAMDSFMRPNTHYITIIRDPATQFESAFTHFQLDDSFAPEEKRKYTTMQARLAQFFAKPDVYRQRLKQMKWENKMGLRWYYAKNNQIFDLGLDHVYHNDKAKVQQYVSKLDREFSLVLITEYFEESLVLLRKMMCWDIEDILYVAKNVRPNPANIPSSIRLKMRQWNDVDTLLYDHFNRTLWEKIKEYGPSFLDDLAEFQTRLKDTFAECVGGTEVKGQGHYFHWIEYKPRKDSSRICAQIAESKKTLFAAIWRRQAIRSPFSMSGYRQYNNRPAPINVHRYPPLNYIDSLHRQAAMLAAAGRPVKPVAIKHVSANRQSKSRTAGDAGDGEDTSSVVVIRDAEKPSTSKQAKTKNVSTNGTRVQAIMTYKKNS